MVFATSVRHARISISVPPVNPKEFTVITVLRPSIVLGSSGLGQEGVVGGGADGAEALVGGVGDLVGVVVGLVGGGEDVKGQEYLDLKLAKIRER